MPIDSEYFKSAYDQWVKEGLAEFQAGNLLDVLEALQTMVVPGTPINVLNPDVFDVLRGRASS